MFGLKIELRKIKKLTFSDVKLIKLFIKSIGGKNFNFSYLDFPYSEITFELDEVDKETIFNLLFYFLLNIQKIVEDKKEGKWFTYLVGEYNLSFFEKSVGGYVNVEI